MAAAVGVAAPGALAQETYRPGPKTKAPAGKPSAPKDAEKDKSLRQEGEALFGGGPQKPAAGGGEAAAHWSIVIEAFREEDQEAQAREGLAKVKSVGGLREAYLERRGPATVIAYGRYSDPNSKQAKADLQKVRGVEVASNGKLQKPFAAAFLAPPESVPGSAPEYDLTNARKLNGDWALYTLQVGVYSSEDPKKPPTAAEMAEFRKTAEAAAAKLRSEGEQAFYYHGPNRSMVTIGLFGIEDFDPQEKLESPSLRALRKRFPYNLQNGLGIRMRKTVTDPNTGRQVRQEKIQPSALMNLPRESAGK